VCLLHALLLLQEVRANTWFNLPLAATASTTLLSDRVLLLLLAPRLVPTHGSTCPWLQLTATLMQPPWPAMWLKTLPLRGSE
jgi:hypothetical protein